MTTVQESLPRPKKDSRTKSHYLPQIEGTRALAVLLVVVYHVFTEQTAGAVDVFFVLTGFLVVTSLLRRVNTGLAGVKDFLVGLFIRLAPVSLVVLLGTYVGALLFLPPVGINLVHREIIASALYFENWQLIAQGSDYLDRQEPPTPTLHFWAMSVQMQFYLVTALVFVFLARYLFLYQSFDRIKILLVSRATKHHCFTIASCPPGAANAMHIIFRMRRHIKIKNMADRGHVKPARGHV